MDGFVLFVPGKRGGNNRPISTRIVKRHGGKPPATKLDRSIRHAQVADGFGMAGGPGTLFARTRIHCLPSANGGRHLCDQYLGPDQGSLVGKCGFFSLELILPMNPLKWIVVALIAAAALATAGHALLNKRDPKAAWGWIAVCLISPIAGPLLYLLLGINRIHTRARMLHRGRRFSLRLDFAHNDDEKASTISSLHVAKEFTELARISGAVTKRPLLAGNRIDILHNGEEAYPAMLTAIESAKRFVYLTTYIFDTDEIGRRFIARLAHAVERGVDVRIMVDGIGELYSIPHAGTLLSKHGVRFARFLPPKLVPPTLHINLRNHRKILVVDGHVAFTGGMNIGERHLAEEHQNPSRVVDVHFRLGGPVVAEIQRIFLEDWDFITGEHSVISPTPPLGAGTAICRAIAEGPNEDLDRLPAILSGAISAARQSISIMTPYFLPPRGLIGALQAAALRGVNVSVILPARNNLPFVHWASRNMLWELLERGVRIYYQPPPFVHTKLLVVDEHYTQIGSANLDPRSLRLNFELVVEVYDGEFARALASHADRARRRSREVSLEEVDRRPLPTRMRDALAWLFTPYL